MPPPVARSSCLAGAPPVEYGAPAGQPALGTYALEGDAFVPIALDVLTLGAGGIERVIAFRDTSALPRFGLPERLGV